MLDWPMIGVMTVKQPRQGSDLRIDFHVNLRTVMQFEQNYPEVEIQKNSTLICLTQHVP